MPSGSLSRLHLRRLGALLSMVLLGVCIIPGSAFGWSTVTWVNQITLASQSYVGTIGFASRDHITVFHGTGCVKVWYEHIDGSRHSSVSHCENPFTWSTSDGYAIAACGNTSTSADVTSIQCDTTKP